MTSEARYDVVAACYDATLSADYPIAIARRCR